MNWHDYFTFQIGGKHFILVGNEDNPDAEDDERFFENAYDGDLCDEDDDFDDAGLYADDPNGEDDDEDVARELRLNDECENEILAKFCDEKLIDFLERDDDFLDGDFENDDFENNGFGDNDFGDELYN